MERSTEESESLVSKTQVKLSGIQSTIGHEESDGNMGGPPSKPKYYLMTDSGAVL